MTECPYRSDAEIWLDGEAGDRSGEIAAHIVRCADCTAHIDRQRDLDDALRGLAGMQQPSDALFIRMDEADIRALRTVTVTRRQLFAGGLAAASVAGLGSLALLQRRGAREDMPHAVLGDFATHIDADRKPDLIDTDSGRVMGWFESKVPFAMPQLARLSDFDLIGGRLCWLLDRRIAAFNFDRDGEALGLYLTESEGLSGPGGEELPDGTAQPIIVSEYGLTGAFWRSGTLAHALVGQPSLDVIWRSANQLRGGDMPGGERRS